MRKGYAAGILLILLLSSFSHILGDEFKTKSMYDLYNPLVVQIASELKKSTDIETAEAVWDWMNSNIQYEVLNASGVENVIRAGKGQCSQQANVAASLLIASGFSVDSVRIGHGNGHAWVEICTDRWHRFDTVYTHSFQYEYGLDIYEEGKDYERIDYYYYDTRENAEIVLIDVKQTILRDIHEICFTISNEGEIRKYLKIEVTTDLEIIGSSGFELTIEAGETREAKIYIRGEGAAKIQIGEIIYETELFYNKDSEKKESLESAPEQSSQGSSEASYATPEESRKKDIEIKKIVLNSPSEKEEVRIVKVNSEQKNPYLVVLLFPVVFAALFIIKKM